MQFTRICTQAICTPPSSLPLTAVHDSELHAKQPHLGFKEWNICIEQSRKTMEQPACFWVVRSQMEFNYLLFPLICAFSLQH